MKCRAKDYPRPTVLETLRAYRDQRAGGRQLFVDGILEGRGYHPKVAYAALEKVERQRLVDCGVSLRSGWLTPEGELRLDGLEAAVQAKADAESRGIQWHPADEEVGGEVDLSPLASLYVVRGNILDPSTSVLEAMQRLPLIAAETSLLRLHGAPGTCQRLQDTLRANARALGASDAGCEEDGPRPYGIRFRWLRWLPRGVTLLCQARRLLVATCPGRVPMAVLDNDDFGLVIDWR